MKRLGLLLTVLLFAAPLIAQQQVCPCNCSGNGSACTVPSGCAPGLGSDIPRNVRVTTPYNGDPTQALISWTTSSPEYCAVELAGELYPPFTSNDVDRIVNGPNSPSTSCNIVVDSLIPNSQSLSFGYGFNAAVNPNGIPSWSLSGPAPRNSTATSIYPGGNQIYLSNTCQFNTGATNPNSPLTFTTMPFAVQDVYQNSYLNIPVTNFLQTGSASITYMVVTHADIDGTNCTVGPGGGACGTERFQFICDNSEAITPATNNYDTFVLQSGPYAGKYFCSNTFWGQAAEFLRVKGGTLGNHTIHYTLTAVNGSFATLGSASGTYQYTVNANPSPLGAPTLTTGTASVNNFDWLNAVETVQFYLQFLTANTTLPGVYLNDSASSTEYTFLPWTIAAYSGDAVALNLMKWYATAPAFQATHGYSRGDKFCSAGSGAGACQSDPTCVLVVTTAGTSGGSAPACPAVGGTVTSGGVTFTIVGNGDFWKYMGQRLQRQVRDQYLDLKQSYTVQEWAIFPAGSLMDCFLEFNPCSGTLDQKAVAFIGYPNLPGGMRNQGIVFDYVGTPMGTIRRLPYNMQVLASYWMMTGQYPTLNGVDVWAAMKDVMIQTGDAILIKSYTAGVNQWPVPMGLDYANFDVGLWMKAMVWMYDTENYMSHHGWSGTPDPRLPDMLKKVADYFYSTQWAVSGNNSFAYEPGLIPNITTFVNNNQTNLNNTIAPAYMALWAWYGDSCNLTLSGVSCKSAATTINSHTWDNVQTGSGKEATQVDEWEFDYIHWLQGDYAGTTMSWFPDNNAFQGAFTNKTEPIVDGSYNQPICIPATHTSANCTWNSKENITNCRVYTGADAGLTVNAVTVSLGASVLQSDGLNYLCSGTATGLNPPADNVLFYALGGLDAQGNEAKEETAPGQSNNAPFQMTMPPGGGTLQITSGNPPNGEITVAYSFNVTAANGTAPYSWAILSGSLPAGINMCNSTTLTCTLSGTPTTAGTSSFQIQISDSGGHHAAANLSITIVTGPSVLTTTLPNGQVGQRYMTQLLAQNGIPPYSWSTTSGSLPPGLTLSAVGVISGTPTQAGTTSATYQVCDVNHVCGSATLSITISGGPPALNITTTSCPSGIVGAPYVGCPLALTGGTPPYAWTIALGQLPAGLSLQSNCTGTTCSIGGVPTTPTGTSPTITGILFYVKASDSSNPPQSDTQPLFILVNNPAPPGNGAVTIQGGNVTITGGSVTISSQ
jgi:hypothetical protein